MRWSRWECRLSPASVIAYAMAFVIAYSAQRNWTFGGGHAHGRALPRYFILQAGCALGSGVLAHVATEKLQMSPLAMSALTTVAACVVELCPVVALGVRRSFGTELATALRFVEPPAIASGRSSESRPWPSTQHRSRRANRAAPRIGTDALAGARVRAVPPRVPRDRRLSDARRLRNGDNDSLLRLVQIRDLIGGQGWFDLHQYRMGPEGGFVMHWSRLVDAPIAAIMLGVAAVTGSMATRRNRRADRLAAAAFGGGDVLPDPDRQDRRRRLGNAADA